MDRRALHDALLASGVSPDAFEVLGDELHPFPGERYVLRRLRSGVVGEPDCWGTYYSERGLMTGLRRFASEDEACRAFMATIAADPSTRR